MQDTEQLVERAQLLYQQGRLVDARKMVQQALAQEPTHTDALQILAHIAIDEKNYDQADSIIKNVISLDPEEDFNYYLHAFSSFQQDKVAEGHQFIDKAIALNPYVSEYFSLSGRMFLQENKYDKALNQIEFALALEPLHVSSLQTKSLILTKINKFEEAQEVSLNALKQDPNNPFTHYTTGMSHLEKGKHKIAKEHFIEALKIDPNFSAAQIGLKEALKSKIAPYRWLLQYSYWLENKGSNFSRFAPIALFIIYRMAIALSTKVSPVISIILFSFIGIYLAMMILSWIAAPIANFFLSFDKEGKYAINLDEKVNGYSVCSVLFIGLGLLIVGFPVDNFKIIMAGIVFILMTIPLNKLIIEPLNGFIKRNWLPLAVILVGFIALITMPFTGLEPVQIGALSIFIGATALLTWMGILRK